VRGEANQKGADQRTPYGSDAVRVKTKVGDMTGRKLKAGVLVGDGYYKWG
jgi:hypothetical protein